MNIFVLDQSPFWCARFHNDRHLVKMILETAQLLCTAHHFLDGEAMSRARVGDLVLRPTHVNHPCAKWVRESRQNYDWLLDLGTCLLIEYRLRFGKKHAYWDLYSALRARPLNIPVTAMRTAFAQCMPVQYRRSAAVDAYRAYYFYEKKHLAKWTSPASTPLWWKAMAANDKQRTKKEVSDHV